VDADTRRAIAAELAGERQLDAAMLGELAGRCESPRYWTSLCPGMSIGGPSALEEIAVADGAWAGIGHRIRDEGYAATPVFLPPATLARLNGAIDALTAAGWPATFAWVFDEFWSAARTTAARGLLAAALGPGARQVPHVWVHVVPAVPGARGWGPHKDGGLAGGSRAHLSVWIALTDATVDNGCMYVLPRSAEAAALVDQDWSHGVVPIGETIRLISGVRALPAPAGSALAWDFDLLHWSGARNGEGPARRSLSLEFIAADVEPAADEHPLIGCGPDDPLPAFSERLAGIASGIVQYGKHEAGINRFRALAERLLTQSV